MMMSPGSLSIEATLSMGILLLVMLLILGLIYSNIIFARSYEGFTKDVLQKNTELLSTHELIADHPYIKEIDKKWRVFNYFTSKIPLYNTYSQGSYHIIYITDTGTKYHKPGCQYVNESLSPAKYDEVKKTHTPCSHCFH